MRHERHSIGEGRTALLGLLIIQAFIGYEWLMSGLAKVVRGGFPSGLDDQLRDKSKGVSGWYKSFLDGTVLPNSRVFAYLIIVGEIAIGVALIAAAAAWLWRWERLANAGRVAVLAATALAAIGGIFMNLNFHLANGSPHPWLIPKDGFDQGVDLDSLMPLLQVVLLMVSAKLLLTLRRTMREPVAPCLGFTDEQERLERADADTDVEVEVSMHSGKERLRDLAREPG